MDKRKELKIYILNGQNYIISYYSDITVVLRNNEK